MVQRSTPKKSSVPHTPHPIPESERSIFFNQVEALRPGDPPLGIEPLADNNMMKVTRDCLFMRTAKDLAYAGGRQSMTWCSVFFPIFFIFLFFCIFEVYYFRHELSANISGGWLEYLPYLPNSLEFSLKYLFRNILILVVVLWLACVPFFIQWHRQLPVIFNRKTGRVSFVLKKDIVNADWNTVQAYAKDVSSISGNAIVNDGVLRLVFPDTGKKSVSIHGTTDPTAAAIASKIVGAAMVWEFIRLYMKEGEEVAQFVQPGYKYRLDHVKECFTDNPFNDLFKKSVWQNTPWWGKPITVLVMFPLMLFFCPIILISDLIYFALDRTLPRRKWPQVLIDACDGVWDGRGG